MTLCVGFDLDMTLIDPRPGMVKVIDALAMEFGIALHGERFADALGPPLGTALRAVGAPDELIDVLIRRFRALYPEYVVGHTAALPGAAAALEAVAAAGGRTLVVTGKYRPNALLHLEALRMQVDEVIGELWSEGKAAALSEHGASVYVGDHLGDIRGARAAGALAVTVPTGPYSADELREGGADVVLASLLEFPDWLAEHHAADSGA